MNVGIDFGTTNSSIAFKRESRLPPECASVDQYKNLPFDVVLRTAVLLDQYGRLVPNGVGAVAVDPTSWVDPKTRQRRRVLEHIKPFLRTFRLREQWPVERTRIDLEFYDHLRQEPMAVTYKDIVESGDLECSREELMTAAAAVFRTLFSRTPPSVMQQDPQIVIGIPLIFPDYAKKRLLDIVVRSGVCGTEEPYREALRRVRFLPEPIGASLLYELECEPPRGRMRGRVLIFDSGGGTLDLALLEFAMFDGAYRPVRQLALGSRILAGRRFDECIERHGLERHREAILKWNEGTGDPAEVTRWQLAQAAESIKVNLSTREEHEEFSLIGAGVRPRITRRDFETWAQPLLDETEALVRETVADLEDVDTVIMVGGSSLIPCVQRLLQRLFPGANVVHEDPRQTNRGEGVERAITAVSRGLALYNETVAHQGITPFAYGFWDADADRVIQVAPKWSPHTEERPVVAIPVPAGQRAVTLTLVQELVKPERVLNVVNVPVPGGPADQANGTTGRSQPSQRTNGRHSSTDRSSAGHANAHHTNADRAGVPEATVHVRVRTSDGSLYPDVELIDPCTGGVAGALRMLELPERVLRQLVENDDHVVRWEGRSGPDGRDTLFPEVVTIAVGDHVVFRDRRADGRVLEREGLVNRIDRIADGLRYQEVGEWDITRWRFYIQVSEYGEATFVPRARTDIGLARRGRRRTSADINGRRGRG